MSVGRLILREILYRKLNFTLGVLSVLVPVGCLVAEFAFLQAQEGPPALEPGDPHEPMTTPTIHGQRSPKLDSPLAMLLFSVVCGISVASLILHWRARKRGG